MATVEAGSRVENPYAKYEAQAADIKETDYAWWKPEPGESKTGRVEYIGKPEGSRYDNRVLKIRDGHGKVWGKGTTACIERELEEKLVCLGDVVTLKYFGEKKTSKGDTFKYFTITVHKRADGETPF